MKDAKKIANALAKIDGNAVVKGAEITRVYVSEEANTNGIFNVVLDVNKDVPAMVAKTEKDAKTGEAKTSYSKGTTNTIWSSTGEIIAMLCNEPRFVFLKKMIKADFDLINDLLVDAKVSVLSQTVKKGEIYVSPFSDYQEGEYRLPNDTIINNAYDIELGPIGLEYAMEYKKLDMKVKMQKQLDQRLSKARKRSFFSAADDDDEED